MAQADNVLDLTHSSSFHNLCWGWVCQLVLIEDRSSCLFVSPRPVNVLACPAEADLLHVSPVGVLGGGGLPHLHPQHLQAGHVQSVSEQDPVTLRGHGHPGISQ